MIHSNNTTICIYKDNNDIVMTTRNSQIVELLKEYGIVYNNLTISDINGIIEKIPNEEYIDYSYIEAANGLQMGLHYHLEDEISVLTTGIIKYHLVSMTNTDMIDLQLTAGDFIIIPKNMMHKLQSKAAVCQIEFYNSSSPPIPHFIS